MSNRFPPNPSDNRGFVGRDRSPSSSARFDRRGGPGGGAAASADRDAPPFEQQHGSYNSNAKLGGPAREPPRGPKAQIGRGGFAPRGRGGFAGRGDSRDRDFRDDTYPKARGRGQDWEARDRDRFDARDRRPSSPSRTRSRSPFREPRDGEARFRRRDSREGLPPGGDGFPLRGRGGYRGRGRGDFDGVKSRPYFNDDRTYDSRNRGWDTPRDYPSESARREDELRIERERDREREPYRVDPIPHRSDSRNSFGASRSTSGTDLQVSGGDAQGSMSRKLSDGYDYERRPYDSLSRDKQRDSDGLEPTYRKPLQDRITRPSSPTPAPAVPAFGSVLPQALHGRDAADNAASSQIEEAQVHPSRRALLDTSRDGLTQDPSPIKAPTAPKAQTKLSQDDLTRPPTSISTSAARSNDEPIPPGSNWSKRFNQPTSSQAQGARPATDVPSVRKAYEEEGRNGNPASTLRSKPTNDPNAQGPPLKIPTGPRAGPSGPISIRQPLMQTAKQPSIRAPMGRGGPTMMGRGRGGQSGAWSWVNPNTRPTITPRGPSIMHRSSSRRDIDSEEDRAHAPPRPISPLDADLRRQRPDHEPSRHHADRDRDGDAKSIITPASPPANDPEPMNDEPAVPTPAADEEDQEMVDNVEPDMFDDDDLRQAQRKHEKDMRLLERKRPQKPTEDRDLLKLLDELEVYACAIKEMTENPQQSFRYPARRQVSPERVERPVEEEEVDAQSEGVSDESTTDSRPGTPSQDSLPFLRESSFTSLSEDEDEGSKEEDALIKDLIQTRLEDDLETKIQTDRHVRDVFVQSFKPWRREVDILDAANREEQAREASTPPESSLEPASVPQSVRSRRIVSDYGIEAIIKESMETAAREDQARREKEEREAQIFISAQDSCNPEREATVPAMLSEAEAQDAIFLDDNDLIDTDHVLEAYRYVPPKDDFTKKEHQDYLYHYVTMPKRFGEIAAKLEGRDFKACVRHYYASKKGTNYRNHEHKFLKSGRGKKFREASERANGTRPRGGLLAALDAPADSAAAGTGSLTESGRPRRAAAPTFGDTADGEGAAPAPPPPTRRSTFSKESTASAQGNERPSVRRGKTATGQKPGRKPKGQQLLAAAPPASQSPSPMKGTAQGKEFRTPEPIPEMPLEEDKDKVKVAAQLLASNLQVQNIGMNTPPDAWPTSGQVGANASVLQPTSAQQPLDPNQPLSTQGTPAGKAQSGETTSYWSVPEKQDFINYVNHFGTDWAKIAQTMKTKSTQMIKNYYMREVDPKKGQKGRELQEAAQAADQKIKRGEDMGPMPLPTPSQPKRRYEANPRENPRPLAPGDMNIVGEETKKPVKPRGTPSDVTIVGARPATSTQAEKNAAASSAQVLAQGPQSPASRGVMHLQQHTSQPSHLVQTAQIGQENVRPVQVMRQPLDIPRQTQQQEVKEVERIDPAVAPVQHRPQQQQQAAQQFTHPGIQQQRQPQVEDRRQQQEHHRQQREQEESQRRQRQVEIRGHQDVQLAQQRQIMAQQQQQQQQRNINPAHQFPMYGREADQLMPTVQMDQESFRVLEQRHKEIEQRHKDLSREQAQSAQHPHLIRHPSLQQQQQQHPPPTQPRSSVSHSRNPSNNSPSTSGPPLPHGQVKLEQTRPNSVPAFSGPPPPPQPKKTSNIMSLLNTEPEEPKISSRGTRPPAGSMADLRAYTSTPDSAGRMPGGLPPVTSSHAGSVRTPSSSHSYLPGSDLKAHPLSQRTSYEHLQMRQQQQQLMQQQQQYSRGEPQPPIQQQQQQVLGPPPPVSRASAQPSIHDRRSRQHLVDEPPAPSPLGAPRLQQQAVFSPGPPLTPSSSTPHHRERPSPAHSRTSSYTSSRQQQQQQHQQGQQGPENRLRPSPWRPTPQQSPPPPQAPQQQLGLSQQQFQQQQHASMSVGFAPPPSEARDLRHSSEALLGRGRFAEQDPHFSAHHQHHHRGSIAQQQQVQRQGGYVDDRPRHSPTELQPRTSQAEMDERMRKEQQFAAIREREREREREYHQFQQHVQQQQQPGWLHEQNRHGGGGGAGVSSMPPLHPSSLAPSAPSLSVRKDDRTASGLREFRARQEMEMRELRGGAGVGVGNDAYAAMLLAQQQEAQQKEAEQMREKREREIRLEADRPEGRDGRDGRERERERGFR